MDRGIPEKLDHVRVRVSAWASTVPDPVARRAPTLSWATRGAISAVSSLAVVAVVVTSIALSAQAPSASAASTESPSPVSGVVAQPQPQTAVPSAPVAPTATPTATQTATQEWEQSSGALPTATPPATDTPPAETTPPPPPGYRAAVVERTIPCGSTDLGTRLLVQGGTLYADCPDYGSYGAILVIDPSTAKITRQLELDRLADLKAVDNGLWVDFYRACTGACSGYLERLDPTTGKATLRRDNDMILADGAGFVWLSAPAGQLARIDVNTLARSTIPFEYQRPEVACGAFFGVDASGYHRLDPVTGTLIADIRDSAGVRYLTEVDGQCWGWAADGANARAQFVRVGQTSVEYRGPWIDGVRSSPTGPTLQIMGGAFWRYGSLGNGYSLFEQLDPTTGKAIGDSWSVHDGDYALYFWAGGKLWMVDAWDNSSLRRLSITAVATPVSPPSAAPSASSPVPTPSPTPAVTPSPGATTEPGASPTTGS